MCFEARFNETRESAVNADFAHHRHASAGGASCSSPISRHKGFQIWRAKVGSSDQPKGHCSSPVADPCSVALPPLRLLSRWRSSRCLQDWSSSFCCWSSCFNLKVSLLGGCNGNADSLTWKMARDNSEMLDAAGRHSSAPRILRSKTSPVEGSSLCSHLVTRGPLTCTKRCAFQ